MMFNKESILFNLSIRPLKLLYRKIQLNEGKKEEGNQRKIWGRKIQGGKLKKETKTKKIFLLKVVENSMKKKKSTHTQTQ